MHWRISDDVKNAAPDDWDGRSGALTGFRFCQKAALDDETVRCIDGFPICQKGCTWQWDCQMHWRIFDLPENCTLIIECIGGLTGFAKKLHLTLKRSDALTGFRYCQKGCIWFWNSQTHWRIFDFWRRQIGRRTDGTADRQAGRNVKWNDACWLLKQANWFAKNGENNDSVVTFLKNVLNRNYQQIADRDVFRKRAKCLKKKINDSEIVNKTADRDAFKERANWVEKKKKDNTSTWSSHSQKEPPNLWHRA